MLAACQEGNRGTEMTWAGLGRPHSVYQTQAGARFQVLLFKVRDVLER